MRVNVATCIVGPVRIELQKDTFVRDLAQKVAVPGTRPGNVIDQLVLQCLSVNTKSFLGERITKPPSIKMFFMEARDSVRTLLEFSKKGYKTYYPEIRFSTNPIDVINGITVEPIGLSLGSFLPVDGEICKYKFTTTPLKTKTNHVLRMQGIFVDGSIFESVIEHLKGTHIEQPFIANPYPLFDGNRFYHSLVAFDHLLTGRRVYCSCARDGHQSIISDAKAKLSHYVAGSGWPEQALRLFSDAEYIEGLCHMCVARCFGSEVAAERYGDAVREFVDPYVEQMMRTTTLDDRTARKEVQTLLGLSRWIQEDEMYQLIKRLFPEDVVLREASPPWLRRQRLDVFLPDRKLALEYQGAQHYAPVSIFGGAEALQRTIERDALKKRACEENQVDLVYIKHSDPLTLATLRARLKRFLNT